MDAPSKSLMQNPVGTAARLFEQHGIKPANFETMAETAVWKAQLKFAFPKLEEERRKLIANHEKKLLALLPINNNQGESITDLYDLELGTLYYLFNNKRSISTAEQVKLSRLREIRNDLAPLRAISYSNFAWVLGL